MGFLLKCFLMQHKLNTRHGENDRGKGFLRLLGEKVLGSFLGNIKDSEMDFLGCLPCESSALGMCRGFRASLRAGSLLPPTAGLWAGFLPYIWQHGLKMNLLKQQIKFGFFKTVILNRSPRGKQPGLLLKVPSLPCLSAAL